MVGGHRGGCWVVTVVDGRWWMVTMVDMEDGGWWMVDGGLVVEILSLYYNQIEAP